MSGYRFVVGNAFGFRILCLALASYRLHWCLSALLAIIRAAGAMWRRKRGQAHIEGVGRIDLVVGCKH